jgi:DNA-directed RNA polymerase subunit RPC12/RpoP
MAGKKTITGKVSSKRYKCTSCGYESMHSTNHYGDIYPRCTNCGWKHPMEFGQVHKCLEPVPEGWGAPEPWKRVELKIHVKKSKGKL